MKKLVFDIMTLEDVMSPGEINDYHQRWAEVSKSKSRESRLFAQCARDDQVVIGEISLFSKNDFQSLEDVRGEMIVARAKALQNPLRKNVNPYNFGKEKKYVYPFWHEYHIWQVAEQLTHGARNKWCSMTGEKNYELIITPKSVFDIYDHLFFREDISAEFIWHKRKEIRNNGHIVSMENGYISYYDDKENKVLARMAGIGFTKEREWRRLSRIIKENSNGNGNGNGEIDDLSKALMSHRIRLDRIGRKPPYDVKELVAEVNAGIIDDHKLENFFSVYDLN